MTTTGDTRVDALLAPEGEALLARIAAAGPDRAATVAFQGSLRRDHPAPLVRLALQVAEARRAASRRFPDADALLFTPPLLEQASAHPVAAHRAARLAGRGRVLDLGCGAGGDMTRLAAAGAAVAGLERDPLAAALARANLRRCGAAGDVTLGEHPDAALPAFDALFADPARRDPGRGPRGARRRYDLRDFSPRPRDLRPLLDRAASWAIKWGPGLDLGHDVLAGPDGPLAGLAPEDYAVELVSWRGVVREAVLWGGSARPGAPRSATVLVGGVADAQAIVFAGDPHATPVPPVAPGVWLAEPDGALIRAGLLDAFVREHGLAPLAAGVAYLTAERPLRSPFLRWWRRLETVAWSPARLQAALDRHDAGSVVVKKRGFPQSPESVRASLRLRGTRALTVLIHRTARGHLAHVAEPAGEEEA